MPWVNTQTGQSSSSSPDWTGGSYSNTQWVNPPATPPSVGMDLSGFTQSNNQAPSMSHASSSTGSRVYGPPQVYRPRVLTKEEIEQRRRFRLLVRRMCFVMLGAVILFGLGALALNQFDTYWTAKNARGPMVYSAAELGWMNMMSKWHHNPTFLGGRDVILDAGIKDTKVFAYQDLTVKGDISNSDVSATLGTLTVGNVENSTLTAHKIVITGIAKNTKQVILPPDRVVPQRRVKHSAAR